MAKFQSTVSDKQVALPSGGVIKFKDGYYATTKKEELEALKKAKKVVEVKSTAAKAKEVAKDLLS